MPGTNRLIAAIPNEPHDRHVAAVAVKAGAQVIVTQNLCGFRPLPDGIEAQSADDFLRNLFDLGPERLVGVVCEQAEALRNPPRTFREVLASLVKSVPGFAADVAAHVGLASP